MPQTIHTIHLALPLRMGTVNCYLIESENGFLLVDTGSVNARQELTGELEKLGCRPGNLQLILLTHGDFDHTGNAAYLSQRFAAKTALHSADADMVQRGDMFFERGDVNFLVRKLVPILFGFKKNDRFTPDILLEVGCDLSVHGVNAKIVHIPGHSKGSTGVLTAEGDLICGDLFENTGQPKLNSLLQDETAAQSSMAALKEMEIKRVYPGHGESFLLQELNTPGF